MADPLATRGNDEPAQGPARGKGTGLLGSVKWIREAYGRELYRELTRALSKPTAEALENALATEWYPVSITDELWETFRTLAHPDDAAAFERAMVEQGKFVAADNLNTVFRVMLIFVGSPEQMFTNFPRLWGQYFEGIRVENDESEVARGRGTTRVYGLGGLRHIAPVAAGWSEFGFRKVGATRVSVVEESWADGEPAADPLVFRTEWS